MIGAEAARSSEDDPLRELAAGFEAIANARPWYSAAMRILPARRWASARYRAAVASPSALTMAFTTTLVRLRKPWLVTLMV